MDRPVSAPQELASHPMTFGRLRTPEGMRPAGLPEYLCHQSRTAVRLLLPPSQVPPMHTLEEAVGTMRQVDPDGSGWMPYAKLYSNAVRGPNGVPLDVAEAVLPPFIRALQANPHVAELRWFVDEALRHPGQDVDPAVLARIRQYLNQRHGMKGAILQQVGMVPLDLDVGVEGAIAVVDALPHDALNAASYRLDMRYPHVRGRSAVHTETYELATGLTV